MKIVILGHARHGKDTVAELLRDLYGLRLVGSSLLFAEEVVFDFLSEKYGYEDFEQCFEDRVNHRAEWFDIFQAYNTPDESRWARRLFQDSDIYVGLRRREEFLACKAQGVHDLSIWVDASRRVPPEGEDSCTVTRDLADYVVENHGSLEDLHNNLVTLMNEVPS